MRESYAQQPGTDASSDHMTVDAPSEPAASGRGDVARIVLAAALTGCWLTVGPHITAWPRLLLLLAALGAHAIAVTALHRHRSRSGVVIGIGATLLVLAVAVPPQGSKDLWAYAMQGRIVAIHHANPYVHPPTEYRADPALAARRPRVARVHQPLRPGVRRSSRRSARGQRADRRS